MTTSESKCRFFSRKRIDSLNESIRITNWNALAGTRKVKPIWILLKQEKVSGSGISWAKCKSALCSRQITMPAPHHSVFYRPDALPAAQPTASKHWRHFLLKCAYFSLCYHAHSKWTLWWQKSPVVKEWWICRQKIVESKQQPLV